MIHNVIFDIGNVLIRFDWESYLKSFGFDAETTRRVADAVFRSETWNDRDQGGKEEEEYRDEFVSHDPACEREIRLVMEHCEKTCVEYPFAAEWIRTIRGQGYRVYLLSNYSKYMFELQRDQFSFYPLVDGAVISYQYEQRKPGEAIYRTLLNKYNLQPEECVFVDDMLPNIQTAQRLGFHTVQAENHEAAVEGLERFGIHSGMRKERKTE